MNTYQKNREPYEHGQLMQTCSACNWWQYGHGLELMHCPRCGAPVHGHVALLFGGSAVAFDGSHFIFHDRQSGHAVSLDQADYPDAITFMLRHAIQGPLPGTLGNMRPITSGMGDYPKEHRYLAGAGLHMLNP